MKGYLENGSNFTCQCKIIGGHILVEFLEISQEKKDFADEIFRTARHIVDALILSKVALEGMGLIYTLEFCKLHTGDIILAQPDFITQLEGIDFEYQEVFDLIGRSSNLRYAIRDFNQGLIDRDNSPTFFRRAIETLGKLICNKEEKELKREDWNKFCKEIGVDTNKAEELYQVTQEIMHPHRHGNHVFFTQEQHLNMLELVRLFVSRSIKFLIKSKTY